MKREITFGRHCALLHNGEKCAKLFIDIQKLPFALADVLDRNPHIEVTDVFKHGEYSCVRMFHSLSPNELLGTICEAIAEAYESDTCISHARADSSI